MRIAGIIKDSLCNGPGIRLTVFLQGCDIKCPGCHNPSTHDTAGGTEVSIEEILSNTTPITTGITVSGGEPTLQWKEVLELCNRTKFPVMIYTGRTPEYFFNTFEVPTNIDYIKAGPFIESLRSTKEQYGSTNQRIFNSSEIKDRLLRS